MAVLNPTLPFSLLAPTAVGCPITSKHLTQITHGAHFNDSRNIEKADMQEENFIRQFFAYRYVQEFILTLFPELSGEEDRWIIRQMTADVVEAMKKLNQAELEQSGYDVIRSLRLH